MSNNSTQNLISFDEVIRLSKLKGVNFGKGDPYNRLRYYIKIGLLPKASRKSFNGLPPAGALPMETVDRMVEIDEKIKEGKSIQTILKESKNETPIAPLTPNPSIQQSPIVDTKIDEDLGLFPVTEVPNSHNLSTSEEKPALNETGQPTSSNNLKGLHFATTFLKKTTCLKQSWLSWDWNYSYWLLVQPTYYPFSVKMYQKMTISRVY